MSPSVRAVAIAAFVAALCLVQLTGAKMTRAERRSALRSRNRAVDPELECYSVWWTRAQDNETATVERCPDHDNPPPPNPCVGRFFESVNPPSQEDGDYDEYAEKCTGGQICIKYSFFDRDSERSLHNTTSFCGRGSEVSHNRQVRYGCHTEVVEGYTKEVCFCQGNHCNGADSVMISAVALILAVVSALGQR